MCAHQTLGGVIDCFITLRRMLVNLLTYPKEEAAMECVCLYLPLGIYKCVRILDLKRMVVLNMCTRPSERVIRQLNYSLRNIYDFIFLVD